MTSKIYIPIWVRLMSQIEKGRPMSQIARKAKINYETAYYVFNDMQRMGLITRTRRGRKADVELTVIGMELARTCFRLEAYLNAIEKYKEKEDGTERN